MPSLNLTYAKHHGETWVILWTPDQRVAASVVPYRWAKNKQLAFGIDDAMQMAERILDTYQIGRAPVDCGEKP